MKQPIRNACLLILGSFIGWLSTGCDKNSSNEATPQSGCRIQKYVALSKSRFYDRTNQTTYDYDEQSNLLKTVTTTDERPIGGAIGGQTGNKTVSYTYSADSFLTASISQELYLTTTANRILREQITTTNRYSYANGRLSGYTTNRVGAYGVTMNTTVSFAYDTDDLISKTETSTSVVHDPAIAKEIPTSSTGNTRIWTYRKGQLVDYVEKSGSSEVRPLTIQDGVVTKISGLNYEVRYVYDSQQRVTKQDNFVEGRLNEYYLQTWTDAKPSSVALPQLEGFPKVSSVFEPAPAGVLATRKTFFWNSVSKAMYQYEESTSIVQTNAQGFITGATITTTHPNPAAASQDVTATETYTYAGCQ